MSGPGALGLVAEVRAFVAGLRTELPELFRPAPAPDSPRTRPEAGLFMARCAHFAPLMGLSYGKVRVKDMRSLWGSCSYRGDLSFNVRLLAAPPEVLDYVVVHELAHRRWRGHGRRFWDLVLRHCPEARERRRWLRANGARLLSELPDLGAQQAVDMERLAAGGELPRQGEVETA